MTVRSYRGRAGLSALVSAVALAVAALLLVLLLPHRAYAAPIPIGANAIVQASGDCLRMRDQPGLAGDVVTCIPDGSTLSVLSDPVASDGLDWQQVRFAGQIGWVANIYLQPASSAPVPTATPAPVPTATPVSVPVPTSANALSTPAPGGLTLGLSGTSDPAALAAAQPFAVESISVLNVSAQRFLSYIPGAPPFASTLSSAQLQP
ncbi:MAG: SH3 domain-containing protein, partial [Chloroflexi bacterium]|nr:SH3 domain-containing protein [Chloroflexota bacterium]